ncbi:WhiB [Mycobacterium phage Cosmo]|uniref:WhiB n=1 Tax=Mycobacterium phage Cosmo TaxID=1567467 RepID=A0A0B4ZZX5_9CAUD|nr:WhiB [Mycobacterium phage Cosmo]
MNPSLDQVALCGPVTKDYDPWFEEDDLELQMEARSVCMRCPIRVDCLFHAVVNDLEYGIFGGLSPEERKPVRDKLTQLPRNELQRLVSRYELPKLPEPPVPEELTGHEASVVTKMSLRNTRAQQAYEKLRNMSVNDVTHYEVYMDCVRGVIDNPMKNGEEIAKTLGRSTAMFNQRLRECFNFCGV